MPDFDSSARPESIAAFLDALRDHDSVVSAARRDGSYLLDVALRSGETLLVYMTNIYVVGVADVAAVLGECKDINVVVTLSAWNMVSADARQYGNQRRVGVFTWKDFWGAMNYRKYWLYEPLPLDIKDKDLAAERRRRKRAWN